MKQKDIIDAWARIRTIDHTIPDDVLDFMKDAAISALNKPDSQSSPLTVIVPPIEWGKEADGNMLSKCGKYRISRNSLRKKDNWRPVYIESDWQVQMLAQSPYSFTAQDAKTICQKHKQAQVNAVLEGCNVIPYRDPQPLLDILKQATTYCESKIARVESGFSDERFIEIMGEKFTSALKSWEEAGLNKD